MTKDLVPHGTAPTDLERRVGFLPNADETERIWKLATAISSTDFVPKSIRGNAPAILAAMLTGRELGILPLRALRQVNVIDGRPTPAPELMMAMALKAGHDVDVAETTRERCVVEVHRSEWPADKVRRLEWTLEDAVDAGLCGIDPDTGKATAVSQYGKPLPWQTYTRAMLRSRAVSEACRTWLPDVVEGASYAPEELGAIVDSRGHAQELVDAADARGEDYDPLEGETPEVRQAVADAMGEEGDVQVDADGNEIVDAETVPSETDDEPADPVRSDAPDAPDRAEGEDLGEASEPVEEPEDPAEEETAVEEETPEDPAGEALEEMVDEVVAVEASIDLSEIPDPTEESARYGAWLAAAADAYAGMNVSEVSHLIRKGHVDLDGGRRLVIPNGTAGLELVARFEEHTPGSFRRTVRAILESAGLPKSSSVPGAAAEPAQEAREEDPGPDTPEEASAPESGSESLEERRAALRRWKAAYRELSSLAGTDAEEAARRCLASRMNAGAGEDRAWATVKLETLLDLVAEVDTARAANLPF